MRGFMIIARLGLKIKVSVKVKGQCPSRMGVVMQQRGRSDSDPPSRTFFILVCINTFAIAAQTYSGVKSND